jgi:hypothetical protein
MMTAHTARRPDIRTSADAQRVSWRWRLVWLLALLAAGTAAAVAIAVAGIVVAKHLTRSSTSAPAAQREPMADSRVVPGETANGASSSVSPRARPRPGQEYLWRPAYVRGKVVLILVRADAANVREDRAISH